jgi:hypothetical protein
LPRERQQPLIRDCGFGGGGLAIAIVVRPTLSATLTSAITIATFITVGTLPVIFALVAILAEAIVERRAAVLAETLANPTTEATAITIRTALIASFIFVTPTAPVKVLFAVAPIDRCGTT